MTSQFTKAERHKIYKRTLEFFKAYVQPLGPRDEKGICFCLLMVTTCRGYLAAFTSFPELLECKPENVEVASYWWPLTPDGDTERIAALERCIQLTKP